MREMRPLLLMMLLCMMDLVRAQPPPPNQDCTDAALLCAQQAITGYNTGAVGWPGFCPGTSNVVWYTFTTNSVGGTVNVNITGINGCTGGVGADNELSAVVLSGNGSCTPGSFAAASLCIHDSTDFTVVSNSLLPNTQYWVIVAGEMNNGATLPGNCDFSISTGGPGANVVNVDFDAGSNVTIDEGQNTQLNATGGTSYTWSPTSGLSSNTGASPIAQPVETTTYSVTTMIGNCTYTDSVTVTVKRLIDPATAMTPNGDGINDTWTIGGIGSYPQADVSIYDRWGQRVYHSVGYKNPFDGTSKGTRLPTATYYWVIELNQLEGQSDPYVGYLTIVN